MSMQTKSILAIAAYVSVVFALAVPVFTAEGGQAVVQRSDDYYGGSNRNTNTNTNTNTNINNNTNKSGGYYGYNCYKAE
ncbi:hypothetical protein PC9H_007147 [Pleurotus ostreatus]|uniref:Uncharacterized protein n=1 Tax=Pleurotus ostreatus TaxID=5322 RepID=A0A8H6ZQJ5_PLEOS|nr:uncharacterized protein PC9H_007147 [Pleurotus ostreatus]KAF7427930.1 hypothetical protein PC9H_007147 [Pleurotus ostreatus]